MLSWIWKCISSVEGVMRPLLPLLWKCEYEIWRLTGESMKAQHENRERLQVWSTVDHISESTYYREEWWDNWEAEKFCKLTESIWRHCSISQSCRSNNSSPRNHPMVLPPPFAPVYHTVKNINGKQIPAPLGEMFHRKSLWVAACRRGNELSEDSSRSEFEQYWPIILRV